jgi:putative transcriptional regulator
LNEPQSFKNQFLIALNSLSGDYFAQSITLLVDHNENGAFGLMINRPLKQDIGAIFPGLPDHIQCPLLEGGPVEQDKLFFLHRSDLTFESTFAVSPDISLTTSQDLVDNLHEGDMPDALVAILGYAGWGAEQLEQELGENTWLLTPASAEIVFDIEIEKRAAVAANQLGVDLNLIATNPGHD